MGQVGRTGETSRFALPSHKVLQHGTFTSALATDHRDLGQVQLHVHAQLGERILELVHDRYQLFHAHVASHRGQRRRAIGRVVDVCFSPETTTIQRLTIGGLFTILKTLRLRRQR